MGLRQGGEGGEGGEEGREVRRHAGRAPQGKLHRRPVPRHSAAPRRGTGGRALSCSLHQCAGAALACCMHQRPTSSVCPPVLPTWQHQLGPNHGGCKRQAPAVGLRGGEGAGRVARGEARRGLRRRRGRTRRQSGWGQRAAAPHTACPHRPPPLRSPPTNLPPCLTSPCLTQNTGTTGSRLEAHACRVSHHALSRIDCPGEDTPARTQARTHLRGTWAPPAAGLKSF